MSIGGPFGTVVCGACDAALEVPLTQQHEMFDRVIAGVGASITCPRCKSVMHARDIFNGRYVDVSGKIPPEALATYVSRMQMALAADGPRSGPEVSKIGEEVNKAHGHYGMEQVSYAVMKFMGKRTYDELKWRWNRIGNW